VGYAAPLFSSWCCLLGVSRLGEDIWSARILSMLRMDVVLPPSVGSSARLVALG
jgi:hypothetical protein